MYLRLQLRLHVDLRCTEKVSEAWQSNNISTANCRNPTARYHEQPFKRELAGESNKGLALLRTPTATAQTKSPTNQPSSHQTACEQQCNPYIYHMTHHTSSGTPSPRVQNAQRTSRVTYGLKRIRLHVCSYVACRKYWHSCKYLLYKWACIPHL